MATAGTTASADLRDVTATRAVDKRASHLDFNAESHAGATSDYDADSS